MREYTRMYEGKKVVVRETPKGWIAVVGAVNFLNPYTRACFSKPHSAFAVTKFYLKHGFFPGKKPRKSRIIASR